MDEYKDLTAQLRLFETVCRHSKKPDIADLARRAWQAIEELAKNSPKLDRGFGEWQADYDGYSDGQPVCDMWWCSECGTYFDEWDDKPTWNFCPNCGADMRQRLKEET